MASKTSLYTKHQTITVAAEDRDGIALAQTTAGAANLVLNGILSSGGVYTATDGGSTVKVGHQVSIYSGADINTVTFTIYGTDPDGVSITDTVTGVNAGAVETTKYFYTVTRVATSAIVGSNVEVGIVDEIATARIPITGSDSGFEVGMGITVTGTVSVSAQLTMDDIWDSTVVPAYIADATLATKTATFYSRLAVLVTAVRLVFHSYSSGAVVVFHVIQNK